jgi:nitroimidazol reductase NimA-like FMN-containing flavoprotein (pyridoxamine 5'-phosphate oxidase superfamily)
MTNQVDPTIIELDEHQCWDLLRSQEVGRLAVAIANHPDIFPVNFVVDHASVVFRTAEGTKLAAAVLGESVAFEVDGESDGEAWSVVVKGQAVEIEKMYELFDAVDLPLYPWHVAPKHRFVRILPEQVTGRRFRVADRVAAHITDPPHRRASPE